MRAGVGLQHELFSRFGKPAENGAPSYFSLLPDQQNGKGFSITCSPWNLWSSQGITQIEFLGLPYQYGHDLDLIHYYRTISQAIDHSKD